MFSVPFANLGTFIVPGWTSHLGTIQLTGYFVQLIYWKKNREKPPQHAKVAGPDYAKQPK